MERGMKQRLLEYFRANPARVLSRDELAEKVWGIKLQNSRTIDQTVAMLRKCLRPGERIVTRQRDGYEFRNR